MQWTVPFEGCEIPVQADEVSDRPVVVLAHGAGSHMEQKTMLRLSDIVREAGGSVVRFNFMYRVSGRSMPDRMPVLIKTYCKVVGSVQERLAPKTLIVGGHSMGGRTASMMEAESQSADGLLLFGYPLHPAGQPEKLRDAHLKNIKNPTLQINGTLDALCTPEIMERVRGELDPATWALHWVEGADHSYTVRKRDRQSPIGADEEMKEAVSSWLSTVG